MQASIVRVNFCDCRAAVDFVLFFFKWKLNNPFLHNTILQYILKTKSSCGKTQEAYLPRRHMSRHNLSWGWGRVPSPIGGGGTPVLVRGDTPVLLRGYPGPCGGGGGASLGRDIVPVTGKGPSTSHWGTPPGKDMGPVDVLWDGGGPQCLTDAHLWKHNPPSYYVHRQ